MRAFSFEIFLRFHSALIGKANNFDLEETLFTPAHISIVRIKRLPYSTTTEVSMICPRRWERIMVRALCIPRRSVSRGIREKHPGSFLQPFAQVS